MKIYLVRHGETNFNKVKKFQGWDDIPLNENGINLAQKTAVELKNIHFDAAFSSPLQRAHLTAEIILKNRNIQIQTDNRLIEINLGKSEGDSHEEAKNNVHHPLHNFLCDSGNYNPMDGSESFDDVKKRVFDFLND